MSELCTDNRFEVIAKAKEALLDSTNIDTSPDEMACLNSFLFRCWQMGWLDKYEKDVTEVVRCKDCLFWDKQATFQNYCTKHDLVSYPNDYCAWGEEQEHE